MTSRKGHVQLPSCFWVHILSSLTCDWQLPLVAGAMSPSPCQAQGPLSSGTLLSFPLSHCPEFFSCCYLLPMASACSLPHITSEGPGHHAKQKPVVWAQGSILADLSFHLSPLGRPWFPFNVFHWKLGCFLSLSLCVALQDQFLWQQNSYPLENIWKINESFKIIEKVIWTQAQMWHLMSWLAYFWGFLCF